MYSMRLMWRDAAAVLALACAGSTEIVNSWKAPGVEPPRFQKVLAVCICRDEATRRTVEDRFAQRINGATQAYAALPGIGLRDVERAKAQVRKAGFDGVVILRPVGVDREATYVPGQAYVVPPRYGRMWGYWGYGWNTVYDPGYVREDVVVNFETNLYSAADEKLVWASRSRTYDPRSVTQAVNGVVDANVAEMKKQKFLAS